MLGGLPNTPLGGDLTVYAYALRNPFFRRHNTRFQLLALAFSLVKITEVYYEWIHGARLLALVSVVSYSFFFVAATIIECKEIILARRPADVGSIDYLVGALPTCKKIGGDKAFQPILRRRYGGGSCGSLAGSLIMTYFLLNQQGAPFILAWAGFQLTWLTFRILMSYVADPLEPMADRTMMPHSWEDLVDEGRPLKSYPCCSEIPGPGSSS